MLRPQCVLELPKGAILCLFFLTRGSRCSALLDSQPLGCWLLLLVHTVAIQISVLFHAALPPNQQKAALEYAPLFFMSWLRGTVQGHGSIKRICGVGITCSTLSIIILLHLLRPSWLSSKAVCPLPAARVEAHTRNNQRLSPRASPRQNYHRAEVSGTSFLWPLFQCIPTLSKSALTGFNTLSDTNTSEHLLYTRHCVKGFHPYYFILSSQ